LTTNVVWLFVFIALYWVYCTHWGVTSARLAGSNPNDYFLASRQIPAWIFALSATVMSFSGWTFLGNPALIFRDGFQFAQLALCAITIPLTGVIFLKRQWMLGKRFGYVTPGEMFSDYFGGDGIRLLVLLVALVFSIPFLGMQLAASGYLIQVLSGGAVHWSVAMWVLTAVVFLYVCIGGMRAVAYVGTLQCLFFAAGIVAVGLIAYGALGGFGAFIDALAKLGATGIGPWGSTAQGYNAYFEIPGVIQFTEGLGKEAPVGGLWTSSMILTYSFALMGIQAAPAFTMWAFSSRDPKGFAPQQVWVSAAAIGVILVFFAVAQGMGAHFLGASPAVTDAGLAVAKVLPDLGSGKQTNVVAYYIKSIGDHAPWFMALLAVCALAAIQAMASAYASTAGTMLARDLYKRFLNAGADDRAQKFFGRVGVGLIFLVALLMATYLPTAQVELGALALAFGFQLWPSLAAICWLPWITRQGATLGLAAGLVAVVLTEQLGTTVTEFFGFPLPWGRWPWTIHSAGWGIFFNVAVCIIVSLLTRNKGDRQHRMKYHGFLAETAALPAEKQFLRPVAWTITLAWLFFAVGPGAVIGNDFFGPPNKGIAVWNLGVPSIWAWQILLWVLGVLVIWLLAYKLEMSTVPRGTISAQNADRGTPEIEPEARTKSWLGQSREQGTAMQTS
jgi:SSS family solute:Na+ symporter